MANCVREVPRKNGVAYVAEIRIKGHPTVRKTFETEKEAENFVELKKAKVIVGDTWNAQKLDRTKLAEVFQDFIKTNKKVVNEKVHYTKKLHKHKEHSLNWLEFNIGNLTLEELTHARIAEFFQTLLITPIPPRPNKKKTNKMYSGDDGRCYSEPTVAKYFSTLREAVTAFAFKHKYDLGDRFENHQKFTTWRPKTIRITDEEHSRIIDACDRLTNEEQTIQYRQLFNLALYTGLRASELVRLQAKNCHLKDKYIFVAKETNKLKKSRSTPIGIKAIKVLEENFASKTEEEIKKGILVFDKLPKNGLDHRIKEIMYLAECKEVTLGCYRHEYLCRILSLTNIDVAKLALSSGHNLKVLLVYAQQYRPQFTVSEELDKI